MSKRLDRKVCLISGGTSGIGLATAKSFLAEGASIAVCGRNPERLSQAAKLLGQDALVVSADTTKLSDLEMLAQKTAKHFGKIDVVVANAAESRFMPMEQITEEIFDAMVNSIFKGQFFTIQKALPFMNEGASIVLISASSHMKGYPDTNISSANKAAVRALARTISADLLDRRIRVNCLSPGPVETPIYESLGVNLDDVAAMTPVKRMAEMREITQAILFLASDDSSYMLGEDLSVDGGMNHL